MRRTIRGGVLLSLPNQKSTPEISTYPSPSVIGVPAEGAELCVFAGDSVKIGDKLAVRDALPILSPISGSVRIENGILFVDNDQENAEKDDPIPQTGKDLDTLTPADIIEAVREAGIPTPSGQPLWQKLERAAGIYLAAIPAFDPEPYSGVSGALAAAYADRLVSALKLIMVVFAAGQGRILLSFSDKKIKKTIRDAIGDFSPKIRTQRVLPVYPAHLDRPLFSLLTGKELNCTRTPEEAGVLILSPAEALAIADLFLDGKRYTHTYVAIDGAGVREPQTLRVPVGTPIGELPGISDRLRRTRVVENGIMRGNTVRPEDFVKPTTRSLTVIRQQTDRLPENCIGCDRCFRACPMYLSPRMILASDVREDSVVGRLLSGSPLGGIVGVSRKGGNNAGFAACCIECGCCSYVCPAGIPLAEEMSELKSQTEVKS